MVLPKGLGGEAREADRHEEGEGCHCPQDLRYPPLHLGLRDLLRTGPDDNLLIPKVESSSLGSPSQRCPAGTVVETTSFIWLVATLSHSAADVEASDPDIIMRRSATLESEVDASLSISACIRSA